MIRGAVLILATLAACAAPEPARAPLRAAPAACVVRGRVAVGANEELLLGPAPGASAIALFTGRALDVELLAVASGGSSRARATVRSSGFVLEGWIAAGAVALHAARDVTVVEGHAAIVRGTRVRVAAGAGTLHLEALDDDFAGLLAAADCTALALERAPSASPAPPAGPYAHLRREVTPLFGVPGGAALLELRARRPGPTVRVLETRAGASRVVYEQGTRITGWLRDDDLDAGEGPDCDDCHGDGIVDSWDRCPDVPEADDGRDVDGCPDADPPPVRTVAAREVAVHAFAATGAIVLGRVERGAVVYVLDRRDGWARVRPEAFVLTPARGADFWVDAGELTGLASPEARR